MSRGSISGRFDLVEPPDQHVVAPDGLEVHVLAAGERGSMAMFSLAAGRTGRAIRHRTVEELWCFTRGTGQIWHRDGDRESVAVVGAGTSVRIGAGVEFQVRADPGATLEAIGVTMPPWPGDDEAVVVDGPWTPGPWTPGP